MTAGFAPAWAMGALAIHSEGDPHLADGTHYRLLTDPRLGLPIRPVHVARLDLGVDAVDTPTAVSNTLRRDIIWTDSFGRELLTPITVTQDNPITATIPTPLFSRCIWVKIDISDDSDLRADAFRSTERGPRTLVARGEAPLSLGASKIDGVVISGEGTIEGATWLDGYRLALDIDWVEVNQMGLPRDNRPRFTDPSPGSALLKALQRVHRGAPKRLGLHDEPAAGSPSVASPTTPVREDAKAAALGLMAADALDELLDVTSAPQHLLEQTEPLEDGVSPGTDIPEATWKPIDLIHTSMHDPAIARSLGFMDLDLPAVFEPDPDHVIVYRLSSWWALDPAAFSPIERLSFLQSVRGLVVADETGQGGPEPQESPDGLPIFQLETLTVAVGHAPPLAPSAPVIDAERPPVTPTTPDGLGPWLPAVPPIARRRADVEVRGLAPAATLAVAEERSGVVTGMNERIDVVGQDDGRALLVVPTTPSDSGELGVARLSHRSVPDAGLTLRVAQSDVFGRWSDWAERVVVAKARPLPPEPVFDVWYTMAEPTDPSTTWPLWGELAVRVQVPPPERLAPGSHLLDHLHLSGDAAGATFEMDVPVVDPLQSEIVVVVPQPSAALLAMGAMVQVTTTAKWVDTAGGESPDARPRITQCTDPRAPAPPTVAAVLDWTAWPDAMGRSRARLTWTPIGAQERFRVFVIDEPRLRTKVGELAPDDADYSALLADFDAAMDRPAQAQVLRDNHRLLDRDWFQGLTDEPIVADPSGAPLSFQHDVSGALGVLIAFKIVAETGAGVGADFDDTPLWVWAVPDLRGPQQPMLEIVDAHADAPLSVTLRLRLSGNPDAAARYRLRRSAVHSDPRRMPVAHTGDIVLVTTSTDPTGAVNKYMDIVDLGAFAHDRSGSPTALDLNRRYTWTVEVQAPDLPGSTRRGAWSRPSPSVTTRLIGDRAATVEREAS